MDKKNIQLSMNSFYKILILSLLNDEPRSGYDLIQSLEGILGNKPSHGKVYPFLNRLQKHKFVTQDDKTCALRGKVVYKLTSEGKKLLINTLGYLEVIFINFLISCSYCGVKFYSINLELSSKNDDFCCRNCKTAKMTMEKSLQ